MSLINFMGKETQDILDNKKSEVLANKHRLAEAKINQGFKKSEVEQEMYKPEKLEKISFKSSNLDFGKKEKISFFVTEEELELLKAKFKIINQFDENRLSTSGTKEFLGVLMDG